MDWSRLLDNIDREENVYKRKGMWLLALSYYYYLKLKSWLWVKNFNKTHISLSYENGKLQILSLKHDDFVKITQVKINKYVKEKSPNDFIEFSLKEALGGCNYIIFEKAKSKNTFIQSWTGNKKLEFDFIGTRKNGLKKYYYGVLGVLADNGLVTKDIRKNFSYLNYKNKKAWGIQADFGKDTQLAANCVEKILTKVYSVNSRLIKVTVS